MGKILTKSYHNPAVLKSDNYSFSSLKQMKDKIYNLYITVSALTLATTKMIYGKFFFNICSCYHDLKYQLLAHLQPQTSTQN